MGQAWSGEIEFALEMLSNPGVDREAVHDQVGQMAAEFFDKELVSAKKKS
jgi:hypothetical protein